MSGFWEQPDTPCAGCGVVVPGPEVGTVWINGALGMVAVRTHRNQHCAAMAVAAHPEQPARRISEPLSRQEREQARR